MFNVANLKSEYFQAILDRKKSTEWRRRKRVDPILEKVTLGEKIALLEIGSARCILATVTAEVRFDYPDGHCLYAIRLGRPELVNAPGIKKIQGWNRREKL